MSGVTLRPLCAKDMPVVAEHQGCAAEALLPMLEASCKRLHEGRYYEQFAIRADGRTVGLASLCERDVGNVSEGVEVFPPFRRCGFGAKAVALLLAVAAKRGYSAMTAQIRTDNAASIALHARLGFTPGAPWINARGREVRTWRKEL